MNDAELQAIRNRDAWVRTGEWTMSNGHKAFQDRRNLLAYVARLQAAVDAAKAGLHHYVQHQPCPCGARQDTTTHPHVLGCPVGVALDALAKLGTTGV